MNQFNMKLYVVLLSFFTGLSIYANPKADCSSSCSTSKSVWLPRSFVSYQEHDLLDTQDVFYKDEDKDDSAVHLSFFTEYMKNFGGKCGKSCKNLGAMPFWSGTNTLTIGNNDGRADLDAYQLGLGNVITDAKGIAGIIQLNPTIQHFGTDMLFHYIHKHNERGFYCKVHAPVGAMKVTPNLKTILQAQPDNLLNFTQKTDASDTSASTTINYQFLNYPVPARRQQSVAEAFYGGLFDGKNLVGNAAKPIGLQFAQIAPCSQTIIRIGDITASLGYNVYSSEKGFFGVAFKASCPTGNVPTSNYVLEPIFGRAGLWGVGGEISGIYNVWDNNDSSHHLAVSVQGEILHLMSGRTPNFRTFDLKKNGPGSKYMLTQYYIATYIYDVLTGLPNTTAGESAQGLRPVANFTTMPVISNIAVEGSFAASINYRHNKWNASIGGEFWGRTKECLSIDFISAVDFSYQNLNDFVVIGRQVSAYQINGQGILPADSTSATGFYCEPGATIGKSLDPVTLIGTPVSGGAGGVTLPTSYPDGIADARISANRIPSDLNEALDIAGAQAAAAYTGKIFGQAGYTWDEHCHKPSLAFLAGAEFAHGNSAISLWSVGLQGSLQF